MLYDMIYFLSPQYFFKITIPKRMYSLRFRPDQSVCFIMAAFKIIHRRKLEKNAEKRFI